MATKSKKPKPPLAKFGATASKVVGNRKITVTIDDERITLNDDGTISTPAIPYLFELPDDFTEPAIVYGWFLPNRFKVEGFGDQVTIEVGKVPHGTVSAMRCISIEVKPAQPGGVVTLNQRLPIAAMVDLAVSASQVICVAYPPGYHGDSLGPDLKPYSPGRILRTVDPDDWGSLSVVQWGREVNTSKVAGLVGKSKPPKRRGLVPDEVLREVAKVYADAPSRERYETVAQFLRTRVGYKYETSGIKEIVSRARKAGYITKPRTKPKPKPKQRGKQ